MAEKDILAEAVRALLNKADIPGRKIGAELNDFVAGCCFSQEPHSYAKKALVSAGIPANIPAVCIGRTCASSMEALIIASRNIIIGAADVILVGGTENMSQSPYSLKNAYMNIKNSTKTLNDLRDASYLDNIGLAVETAAREYGISRNKQDDYSVKSYEKARYAQKNGWFKDEIEPVRLADNTIFNEDEHIQFYKHLLDSEKNVPLFCEDGTITKKNATSINDGASAVLLMSERACEKYGIQPEAEIISSVVIGVDPGSICLAPHKAFNKLLDISGIKEDDIDLIECNEAYAAQMCICLKQSKWNPEIINIGGGSIPLGHPLGSTGLRICITLLHHLKRNSVAYGVAVLCGGGGIGSGVLIKNLT